MKKRVNKFATFITMMMFAFAVAFMMTLSGCGSTEDLKLRDLEFTILSEEKLPEQLTTMITEQKEAPFQFTYSDNENLYICVGYGKQESGGYSIAVNELYLTEENIHVDTNLLGPESTEKSNKVPSYPYIVFKTEYLDKTVIFE